MRPQLFVGRATHPALVAGPAVRLDLSPQSSQLARAHAALLRDRIHRQSWIVQQCACGIASGIDMALAFIEQADGPIVAAEVAREMVVYLRRDGAQEQSSVYLDYRTHLHPGVPRVQDWIVRNPATRATLPT